MKRFLKYLAIAALLFTPKCLAQLNVINGVASNIGILRLNPATNYVIIDDTFSASSTNYGTFGAATWTVSGGNLTPTGLSSITNSQYVLTNYVTASENYTLEAQVTAPGSLSAFNNIGLIVHSMSVTNLLSLAFDIDIGNDGTYGGGLNIRSSDLSTAIASSSGAGVLTTGVSHVYYLKVQRRRGLFIFEAQNLTTGQRRAIHANLTDNLTYWPNNYAAFGLCGAGTDGAVVNWWRASLQDAPCDVLAVGDSLFVGAGFSISSNRWSDFVMQETGARVGLATGAGNFTDDVLASSNDWSRYKASILLCNAAINDLTNGRTVDQVYTNLLNIQATATALGMTPVFVTPVPYIVQTNANTVAGWMVTNLTRTINVYGPMMNSNTNYALATSLTASASDRIHLSLLGQFVYGKLIAGGLQNLGVLPHR